MQGGSIVVQIHCLGRSGLSENGPLGTDMHPPLPPPKQEHDTQTYSCFASFCVVVLHLFVVIINLFVVLYLVVVVLCLFEVNWYLLWSFCSCFASLCSYSVSLCSSFASLWSHFLFLVSTIIWVTFCRWMPRDPPHTSGLWACGW